MKTTLKPISKNEKSFQVTKLHQVLELYGLTAAKADVRHRKAGASTEGKISDLQEKLKVQPEKEGELDQATITAIEKSLEERGHKDGERSFTVTGSVLSSGMGPVKKIKVYAFDLDLKAVATYRTISKDGDFGEGYEFLGETETDLDGRYSITFFDWQFRDAERGKADVVVFALQESKPNRGFRKMGNAIVGRSALAHTEDYSSSHLLRNWDIILESRETGTEYHRLMVLSLNPFLKESQSSLDEIAENFEQIDFAAREIEQPTEFVQIAATAALFQKNESKDFDHELLYGLGRKGYTLTCASLFRKRESDINNSLEQAAEENIISKPAGPKLKKFLEAIEICGLSRLQQAETISNPLLDVTLNQALPKSKQEAFLKAARDFKGKSPEKFWKEDLPKVEGFDEKLVERILYGQQLTTLTGGHTDLVEELWKKQKSVDALFAMEESQWKSAIQKAGLPGFVKGENDKEKAENYYRYMQGLLTAAFPTRRIAKMVGTKDLKIEQEEIAEGVSRFLSDNESFDFRSSKIHEFEEKIKALNIDAESQATVSRHLKELQRVFQVSSRPENMQVLRDNGYTSAYHIAATPRKNFIKTMGPKLMGKVRSELSDKELNQGYYEAYAIHQRASHINARCQQIAMQAQEFSRNTLSI